jgi:hypothetical protein
MLALFVGLALCLLHPVIGLTTGTAGVWMALAHGRRKREAAQLMCGTACTSAARTVDYIGWSGTIETFDIHSEHYALRFVRDNASKVVNMPPEVWTKLSTPPAMPPVAAVPSGSGRQDGSGQSSDAEFLKWVERIEVAKGPAARRAAIELGLKALSGSHRVQFIQASTQVEVRATLDKVDSLKTRAAKRRHLADAIRALRSDSVDDELQAREIATLEGVLAELGHT